MEGGGGGGGGVPPPPPQPGAKMTSAARSGNNRRERRRVRPSSTKEKNVKLARAIQRAEGRRSEECDAAVAAVVVIVTMPGVVAGVPAAAIVAGLNRHAVPAGSFEQEKEMVPLNPVEEERENGAVPEEPGAEIIIADCGEESAIKNPGVIVKDWD